VLAYYWLEQVRDADLGETWEEKLASVGTKSSKYTLPFLRKERRTNIT